MTPPILAHVCNSSPSVVTSVAPVAALVAIAPAASVAPVAAAPVAATVAQVAASLSWPWKRWGRFFFVSVATFFFVFVNVF